MQVICEGTYIDVDGPTFKHDDKVRVEVDCCGPDEVYVHFLNPGGEQATIKLPTVDARGLAKELKRFATISVQD
jgi:hypothetical protein